MTTITLLIAILLVGILNLGLLALVVVGVSRLRDDFSFWQTALFRIEWFTDPGKQGRPIPQKEEL
jgi:hypothetical protein